MVAEFFSRPDRIVLDATIGEIKRLINNLNSVPDVINTRRRYWMSTLINGPIGYIDI